MAATAEQGDATRDAAARPVGDPASCLRLALDVLEGNSVRQAEPQLHWALGNLRETAVLGRHADWVTSASFGPDGRFVLTASLDHRVTVFDVATGEPRASFDIGAAPRFLSGRPQFSFDGTMLIVPGFDGRLHIGPWEGAASLPVMPISADTRVTRAALTRDNRKVITGHSDGTVRMSPFPGPGDAVHLAGTPDNNPIACVAVSPNGRYAAAGMRSGELRLWDLDRPDRTVVLEAHSAWANTVGFSDDNRLLVSSSDDCTAQVFSVPDGWLVAKLSTHADRVNSAAFSQNAEMVVTAGVDKTARVFAARTGQQLAVMRGVADEVQSAEFSPDGKLVAMASVDGTARVCYTHNGGTLFELDAHIGAVFTAAFDSSGTQLVTAGADRTARLWDVDLGHVFWDHRAEVNTAVFSRDGRYVASACEDGKGRVFEATGDTPVAVVTEHAGGVNSAAFNDDGALLVTAGQDHTARVTEWQSGHPSTVLHHKLEVDMAVFTSDGNQVITCTRQQAELWDWRAGQSVRSFAPPPEEQAANPFIAIIGVDISRDNSKVVTAHYDQARLWNAETGTQLGLLKHDAVVYTAVFSDDSSKVITASGKDGHARIWDANTCELIHTLAGPSRQLRCAALSPDGQLAAAGDAEGHGIIWRVISEQVVAVRQLHTDIIMSVAFSPDSAVFVTAGDDHLVRTVDIDSLRPLDELVTMARQRLGPAPGNP